MQKCEECIHNEVCTDFMKNGLFPNCFKCEPVHKRLSKKDCDCKFFQSEKHGNWLRTSEVKGIDWYKCSLCGNIQHQQSEINFSTGKRECFFSEYCSKCGAKMDRGDKNAIG